jgi:hypothetical protein
MKYFQEKYGIDFTVPNVFEYEGFDATGYGPGVGYGLNFSTNNQHVF